MSLKSDQLEILFSVYIFFISHQNHLPLRITLAVYHKRGNHSVTLYEKRLKIRYHLRGSPLG